MTPEGKIAAALKAETARRGLFIRKLKWEGRIGAPDYIILHAGRAFFIETKAPGEKPRPSQRAEFLKIAHEGFEVTVVDSEQRAQDVAIAIAEGEL